MKKKTTSDFIREATLIHGNKYDYSLVDYTTNNIKLNIICRIHGEFKQKPVKHINAKQGCPICGDINTHNKQRKTKDCFIEESQRIHKNKYDYSLVEYVNYKTDIKILCPEHGVFEQAPNNHLQGKGCKYCGGTTGMDTKLFIKKAKSVHGDKYDYSLVDYDNAQTKIKILCPEHGIFEQTPNNHLSKEQGCYECLDKVFNTETFIKKAKDIHNYDYSLVNYVDSNSKIKILCSEHGVFEQIPNSHLQGSGCPSCGHINSKKEKEVVSFVKSLNVDVIENNRTIVSPLELDIYIPSHKLAIEFDGLYWHNEVNKPNNYHLNKTVGCEKQGIQLIHIFEDEWLCKKDIVKSRIINILGLNKHRIYARKCVIKEVSPSESTIFLDINHLQGATAGSIKLGLYHDNELVSLMTFGSRPMFSSSECELIRFCNKLDTSVIGGADKLLKYFIKTYQPKEITSYADRRWSQGGLYEKLGFEFIHNSTPNYYYLINKQRHTKFGFRKHILVREGFDPAKSEHEIMLERGIYRIYDCGVKKYQLTF